VANPQSCQDAARKAKLEGKAKDKHEDAIRTPATAKNPNLFQAWELATLPQGRQLPGIARGINKSLAIQPNCTPAMEYRAGLSLEPDHEVQSVYMALFQMDRPQLNG
jgi:hypothetical protein